MSEQKTSDFGTVYFSNMTNQSMQITLNQSINKVLELGPMGGSPTYTAESVSIARVYDPSPYQSTVFGSKNLIQYRLGRGGPLRSVTVDVNYDDFHINRDIQVYMFYQSLVIRLEGSAREYSAELSM